MNIPYGDRELIAVTGLAFRFTGEMDPDPGALGDGWQAAAETTSDRVEFDRGFFDLSASAVASMPVRERTVLELAWSALADAGVLPDELAGRTAGVFLDANAGGVATFLRLTGPVVPVRCGASSAVLAVQAACRSLLAGECDFALAGGAHPDFGAVTGSAGAGVLALTPLSRAEAAQDLIRYVIRDSASATGSGALDPAAGLAGLFAATARLADPAASDLRIIVKDGQLVLSAPPPGTRVPATGEGPAPGRVLPWVLSAKTTRSLRGQAALLAAHVASHEELRPADVAYSLSATRPGFSHRAVVLARDRGGFQQGLSALASGEPAPGVIEDCARPGRRVVFLFPGEGGQRPGMGRELYQAFAVFADALDEACERMAAHASWSVRELLLGEEERCVIPDRDHALYTQDGLFALQFALFRLLTEWEVPVDYVLGHSVGEFAAATAAGVFSLDAAAALMAERVRLVRRHMPVGGAMAAIAISADEAMESTAGNEERVSVAAINGPSSVVLSGDRPVVGEIVRQWAGRGRKVKELPVNRAFHSHHFDALLPDFERFMERLPRSAPRIPLVSILYGRLATAQEVCAAGYLPRQVRGTSQFLSGLRWLEAAGVDTFVELSASGVLSALGRDCLSPQASETAVWIPTLRGAGRSDEQSLLTAVAQLHANGVHVSWRGPLEGHGRRVRLPGYAFEPVSGAQDDSPGGFAGSLATATPAEQAQILLDLVRAELAAVLERPGLAGIEPEASLRELGFTSLAVVELAGRLTERVGIRVGAPLIFDHPSPLKLATELARRLLPDHGAAHEPSPPPFPAAANDPIAIVGMSCLFPGGVRSPEELWDVLAGERDVICELPANRDWNLDALYDPEPGRPGRSYVREGGFLAEAGEFDAGFFGISPAEALGTDPQQRLLLESAWEALERAWIDPASIRGSRTGVFVGLMHGEYGARSLSGYGAPPGGDPAECVPGPANGAEAYLPLGTAASIAAGRIAYVLGLEGPVITLDTACSSSLVALHLAAQALRSHECDLALAGAATVMTGPLAFLEFSRQRALAPDARCKPFSAAANGTAWSEGVGMLVVERLSDASRHRHRVLAIMRGSAVNSDGASNGLTAPNGLAQQRVIRAALANARLRPDEVDAVEAHGTGTTLGDPIEAEALLATYGQGRATDRPLLLGSAKSNLGHAQVAAGMAGVIKMVLAIRAGEVPATLHFDRPSPHVDWGSGAVEVVTRATPWPSTGAPRRAGVSAFGVSGTNAHVILEEAAADHDTADHTGPGAGPVVRSGGLAWPVSGRTMAALRAQAERLAGHVAAHPELDVMDVGWSLAVTRSVFPERAVVTGRGREDLMQGLAAVAAGEPAAGVVSGAAGKAGKTVFVFPGQGSQWAGMGQELAACSPVFAGRLAECAAALAPYTEWDLSKVLAGDLGTADTVQPALWAVMVSLAAVWEAAGVVPDAVVGHSQGEIAAACVAGILSLEDAAKVVALRSRALTSLAGRGGMLSVAEPADRVRDRLAHWGDRLSVAAVNGRGATVVSGEPGALHELVRVCQADGVRVKPVPVDYASHGAQVNELRDELLSALRGISPGAFGIPMISAMTGEMLRGPEADATYWYESLRAPVEFDRAVQALAGSGHGVFVEVSPHPVLVPVIADSIDAVVTGTLRRGDGGPARLLASLGEAWTHGAAVNWATVLPGGQRVDLPTYAFQRQRYWPEPSRGPAAGGAGADPAAGGWRYRLSWVPVPEPGSARWTGTWLVVAPAGHAGLVEEVLRALAARGAETVVIQVAAGWTGRRTLVACLGVARDVRPVGVVSLLALDETPLPGHPVVVGGLAGTLELVQALGDAGMTAPLWVVTRGAAGTSRHEAPSSPVQAQAWGLGRVAGLEYPRRWGGLVDLPPAWDERVARLLCGVLAGGTGEDEVAIRGTGVLARRLVRAPSRIRRRAGERGTLRGTVLLTGGTGAIGPHLAGWLARRGAEHLVLPSRTGPAAPEVAALAAGLAAAGVRVSVLVCDIARREPLAGLLRWIAAAGPPLRAVVHAAVSIDLVPLEAEGIAGLAAGLTAKVAGAALLDELTAGEDLDSFVLFSSITGVWGSSYHGAYAAANAYLDALALGRRARGLPATSVAWGVWEAGSERGEAGAVPQSVNAPNLRRQGLGFLDADRALESLEEVLADGETLAVVADVDWARYAPVYRAARAWRLFDEIPEAGALTRPAGQPGPQPDTGLTGRLADLPAAGRERAVTDLVRAQAAAVLGYASASEVAAERAFREMGLDSLTAVRLRDRLNEAAGLRLPSTAVFDYPSPVALARYVLRQLPAAGEVAPAFPAPAARAQPGDPVVIVGMGCRFPGGVSSPEELWELVARGKEAVSRFPQDRGWDTGTLYDPDPDHAGTSYTRQGGFLEDAAGFDAGFFGISPREAHAMDPQQRLLLEVCWEAIEQAGISPAALRGAPAGVFAGASQSGYEAGHELFTGHLLTGNAASVLSGRVSYVLGLEGPSVTLDTACSSSLVALHLAVQALHAGDCDLALAGGVAVMASPAEFIGFSAQRALSPDGRCKAFGAAADGMGLAEGAGILVLERLADARRNGHRVLAVVAGSAVNSDGASNGLTAPNGPSQERVIRAALASAGLTAADIDAVEAHGTGTRLGDPIEALALLATYGQERPEDRPVWLGSVKSNLGHPQAAAGAAGVIKTVLALKHGMLPPTLHASEPSPEVDWTSGAVSLLTEPVPWPPAGRPRRAAVSAFGMSGTNAHVIIEEAPAGSPVQADAGDTAAAINSGAVAWLVSGRSGAGLAAQARRLLDFAAACPDADPLDIGWSLATTRAMFEHRAAVTGVSRADLLAGLATVAAGQPASGVVMGSAGEPGKTVFVFPGQGSHWTGMGRDLAAASPVFAARLAECSAALAPHVDWSLPEVLAGDLGSADVVQPAVWAVMVSLAAVWEAAGVVPDAVVGHSQGEIAAACVAGILPLEDAAKVVALRSRALTALAGRGGMLSVASPGDEVRGRLESWGDRLSVAAVNGPAATVVSGEPLALDELAAAYKADGVRVRRVPVDYASHSGQVEALRDEILSVLHGISPGPSRIPMISAMTGEMLREAGPEYWYESLRAPVAFDRAVRVLVNSGHRVFIEVSPHPVLVPAVSELAVTATGTLRRDDGGPGRLLASLAEVWMRGTAVDWAKVLPAGRRVELPTYAFQHQRYWPAPALADARDVTAMGLGAVGHPLLGAVVELAVRGDGEDREAGGGLVLTGRLSMRSQPWLADHELAGTVLVPGTALVEMAVRAADAAGCGRLQELTLEAPLVLPRDGAVEVQVSVGIPDEPGRRRVEVFGRPGAPGGNRPWRRYASGLLAPKAGAAAAGMEELAVWPPSGAVPVPTDGLYDNLAALGHGYGPVFRGLRAAWRRGDDLFAEVALPEEAVGDAGRFGLHPALLDAALHVAALTGRAGDGETGTVWLPFAWGGVCLHAAGACALRIRLRQDAGGVISLVAADAAGAPVLSVESLVRRPADAWQLVTGQDAHCDCLYAAQWVPAPVPASGPDVPGDMVVIDAGPLSGSGAEAARRAAGVVLERLQQWLADDRAPSRLVVMTRGAVAAGPGERVADLAGAAVWGLVRSVQSENPGRIVLADLPAGGAADAPGLLSALGLGEPELALRDGEVYVRRLARLAGGLVPPETGPWRLDVAGAGMLDGLTLVPYPEGAAPLGPGQVRVAVRAAALNPHDAVLSPGTGAVSGDVAGVVMQTGPGVSGLAVGDRVLGLAGAGLGPVAVTDARLLVKMAEGWSFADAAALADGAPASPPARCWDVRRAPEAFRFMSQAQHTGKIVLTVPPDPAAPRKPGTVLVTGGTGLLGGLVARHLAATGRVAEVVLASRSGPAAPGVAGLAAGIAAGGTGVRVTTCDVADRVALAGLLTGVRLTGVVHAAGVLDDGVAQSLTPARIDAVMRPKADAAWHLHELTRDADLEMFVLFSAAAATLGSAGQGNYSAANAFLDALAAARQAAGLPAVSLAWGLWADPSAMTGHLREADRARMARSGILALTATEGLALLDAALARDEPLLVPARLDIPALRAQAAAGKALPALLRDLVGPAARPAAASAVADAGPADALRQRLAAMPGPERDRVLLDLVRTHAAAALGHSSPQAVNVRRPFSELGFDSLTAVELRNRLSAATGLRLPATLVFERPTPRTLADHLRAEICSDTGGQAESTEATRSRPPVAVLMDALLQTAGLDEDALAAQQSSRAELIDAMDTESLVRMAFDAESTDF